MLKKADLVISKNSKQQLTKSQIEFNKVTSSIEKLQNEISKKQNKLDLAIQLYGKEICPLKNILQVERNENIILLWEHYKKNRLSKTDQRKLKEIIREQLQTIFDELTTEPNEIIKHIFKEIEGDNYDDLLKEEEDEMKQSLLASLKKENIDISDIDINDDEALFKKMFELNEQLNKSDNIRQPKKNKKASLKQIEAEKRKEDEVELKKKNISSIYKQLAKLFHPDLEQDEMRKTEKMLLMQELTAAYENKDLHALLTLELKWIHNENAHLETLTDEKLTIYLQILKGQVNELTMQKQNLINQPQYAVLVEEFGWQIQQDPLGRLKQIETNIKLVIDDVKNHTQMFKSEHALKHIKKIIKQWKERDDYFDDELFDILFGKM